MSGFKACLFKDLKLFFKRAGILSLLLPLLLYAAMYFGFRSFSSSAAVQPFPIAIRDEDNTLMSRNLILQMKDIPMFSEVRVLENGETDREVLEQGAAAVVTIPQYLFYKMYAVEECPVDVAINDRMELPSALFRSIFGSIMSIMESDESSFRGAYRYMYTLQHGPEAAERDLEDPAIREEINRKASAELLSDALGRQTLFDTEYSASRIMITSVLRDILAGIFLIMVLGYAVTALKTIPEERRLGVIPRLEALGHSSIVFYLSKLITVFLLLLPILFGLFCLLPRKAFWMILPWTALFILLGFLEILLIAEIARDSRWIQQIGNLFLLLMLISGGTFWPRAALPGFLRAVSGLSVSYYFSEILEIASNRMLYTPERLIKNTCTPPMILCGILVLLILIIKLTRKLRPISSYAVSASDMTSPGAPDTTVVDSAGAGHSSDTGSAATEGLFPVLSLSGWKALVFFGSPFRMILILLFSGILLFSVETAVSRRQNSVRISVRDLDQTEYSEELIQTLGAQEGVTITDAGGIFSLEAEPEGTLTIPQGFGNLIAAGKPLTVHYEAARDTYSEQSTREIISGAVISEKSLYKSRAMVEKEIGRTLSDEEFSDMKEMIRAERASMPDSYQIRTLSELKEAGSSAREPAVSDPVQEEFSGNASGSDPNPSHTDYSDTSSRGSEKKASLSSTGIVETFLPDTWTFSILVVTILSLTYTSVRGSKSMRAADRRLRTMPHGPIRAVVSDTLPIAGLLLIIQFTGLALGKNLNPYAAFSSVLFSVLMAQFGLWISSVVSTEGRVDGLACFLSIMILLIGGCFLDLSVLSDGIRTVTWISPAGLARAVMKKNALAAGLLLLENILLTVILLRKRDLG
ncbi:ABC transporter permease [[Clostridium] aminophilum]|uniref:ABC-type multidrug transport system, permease component n=1 Tax=[Clostridium] aminophilum TaxID=1526 RepID=A0A1I6J4T8_9FIRM|nr:ABC transporter permease [[Clostridium] aminophilum]SFR73958.1 ABC-type multidrug transport system, permease component [[Clostridium] aminophilum]